MIENNNDWMSDNLSLFRSSYSFGEAGFVDPEFFIVKLLPENLSTSYGGTCCVVRYVRTYPDLFVNFSSLRSGNEVFNFISNNFRRHWKD